MEIELASLQNVTDKEQQMIDLHAECDNEGDQDPFESCFFSAPQEPVSYAAAMRASDTQQWLAAMNEEKEAFFANGTWVIVDVNPDWNLLF